MTTTRVQQGGDPFVSESAWAAYGALVTAAYVTATVLGLGSRPLTMAVGAGTAALATAAGRTLTPASLVALAMLPVATAASFAGGRGRELAATAALVALLSWRQHRLGAALCLAGAALLGVGVVLGRTSGASVAYAIDPGDSILALGAIAAAAAALALAALVVPAGNALRTMLVPALLAAFAAAGSESSHAPVAVAFAGVAALVAVAFDRPAGALAALAVGASVASSEPAIAGLLAAAAVVVAPFPVRPASVSPSLIVALPALAGLAAAAAANPTALAVGLSAFALVASIAVAGRVDQGEWSRGLPASLWPTAAIGLWLAFAPQTWGWLGPVSPSVAAAAAGLATAAAVIALLLVASEVAHRRMASGATPAAPRPDDRR